MTKPLGAGGPAPAPSEHYDRLLRRIPSHIEKFPLVADAFIAFRQTTTGARVRLALRVTSMRIVQQWIFSTQT
jgi:hypothetical protein